MTRLRLTVVASPSAAGEVTPAGQPSHITDGTPPDVPSVVAGEHPDRLEIARDWLEAAGSVAFCGPFDADLRAALHETIAASRPVRALRCAAAKPDRRRPLHGVAQLLSSVTGAELAALPSTHRATLATADLGATTSRFDVGYALLSLTRVLTSTAPLRFVIENVQWLDHETTRALRFVTSRVNGLPVHTALTEQIDGSRTAGGHRLCPPPLLILWLPRDEWRRTDGPPTRS